MEFWEYSFNKRLEHYFFYVRVFLSLSMLDVIVGEDSLLWRVSSRGQKSGTPGKSLMYTLNKAGPRMDPWATPRVDLRVSDVSEPIHTYCLLSCM